MTNEKKYLIVKEIFEKIKPKIIENCGEDALKFIKVQSYYIFIESENNNFEKYFFVLKNELKDQFGIEIGNKPVGAIKLNFEEKVD
ncbi:MAG: hypothetical protein ACRC4Y_05155 [Cetobacterium sp.]